MGELSALVQVMTSNIPPCTCYADPVRQICRINTARKDKYVYINIEVLSFSSWDNSFNCCTKVTVYAIMLYELVTIASNQRKTQNAKGIVLLDYKTHILK